MKTDKVRIPLILTIVAIVAVMGISGAIAFMLRQSQDITNTFVPAQVTCQVQEQFDGVVKSSVKVENTSNISAYIRIRLVTYWQDSKGNIVGKGSPEIPFGSEWVYNSDDWIYDPIHYTFYHKNPVAAGDDTADLLKLQDGFTGIKLEPTHREVNGVAFVYYPVMVFLAEAIQSEPGGESSPVTKWGVKLDANGRIESVNSGG